MATSDGQLHVGRLSAPAWQSAVDQLADDVPDVAQEQVVLEWRAAGIVDAALRVAPDWQRAIDAQARSTVSVTLVARMEDVAFLTALYICPGLETAVTVTLRATTDASDGRIDMVHPQAEVAMAPSDRPWVLLRRVVPPLDAFRAERGAPNESPVPLHITQESLATAEAARASVFAFGVHADTGRSDEAVWYLGDNQLHRLSPDTLEVLRVTDGDVASGLLSLITRLGA